MGLKQTSALTRVRTAAFAVTLVICTLIIAILVSPAPFLGRRAIRGSIKLWARFSLFLLRFICGVSHRLEGAEHAPTGGALVAANHQSMWETIALLAILKDPVIAFKKELLRVPIYGWWAVKAGSIPVDRKAGVKALRALTEAARERIAEGRQVVLFPEGTRARPGQRLRLQPGVASIYLGANTPCTPVVHDSGRFWRPPGGLASLKSPGTITIRFLPPIAPGLDRKSFMTELRTRLHGTARETTNKSAGNAAA